MVRGLNLFRERFRAFEGSFTLIGGVACHEWFGQQGLKFRPTKDLDVVLMLEVLRPDFVTALRTFIADGRYEIKQRSETPGTPVLYRFAKPAQESFPYMIELFSRSPEGLDLALDQTIVPIKADEDQHSLSAILMNDDYYGLLQAHNFTLDGLRIANATSLIPLKAKAWLDLSARKAAGQKVESKDIQKHRSDVFRLAATLPGTPGPELPASILSDLSSFLTNFPENSPEWPGIQAALRGMNLGNLSPARLRQAIQTYFRLA